MKSPLFCLLFILSLELVAQENGATEVKERLAEMEAEFQAVFRPQVVAAYEASVAELNTNYEAAVDRAQQEAAKRGDLSGAVVLREEKTRATEGKGVPKPDEPNTPPAVAQLRTIYHDAKARLDADRAAAAEALVKLQDQKLSDYQTLLTTRNQLDDALLVKAARDALSASLRSLFTNVPVAIHPGAGGYLGHLVWETGRLGKFPKGSNLVIDVSWESGGDAVIREARLHKLKVVLGFGGESLEAAESKGIPLALANRDVVIGLMWRSPYHAGFTPEDLTAFGNKVHRASPRLQFWGAFVEKPGGKYQTQAVPPEVDAVVVVFYYAPNPDQVIVKTKDILPGWLEKAKGRPVLLEWNPATRNPVGIVPETVPGTMAAMQTAREGIGGAGLILGQIGKNARTAGLDEKQELLNEIKEKVPPATRK